MQSLRHQPDLCLPLWRKKPSELGPPSPHLRVPFPQSSDPALVTTEPSRSLFKLPCFSHRIHLLLCFSIFFNVRIPLEEDNTLPIDFQFYLQSLRGHLCDSPLTRLASWMTQGEDVAL